MRRESSTVVVLVGAIGDRALAGLGQSMNVSVARAEAEEPGQQPSWETGARAMAEAARRRSAFVLVTQDPLADLATAWQSMWTVPATPDAAAGFEEAAAQTAAAWRRKQFELPDYYVVMAPAEGSSTGPDLYLGPLRAARPRRVVLVAGGDSPAARGSALLDTLRSLEHGPWWPPLDELVDAARRFYAGGLTETQLVSY
jgi:hypothetical protein